MAVPLTAFGEAFATGRSVPISSKQSPQLKSAGVARSGGSAALVRTLPMGGLTDLGIWESTQPDSVMSRALSGVATAVGTDATAARGSLTATAPKEYNPSGTLPLWKSAAYAGVGIKWTGMPNAQAHAYSQVQFEEASFSNRLSWAATSWEERSTYTASSFSHLCTIVRSSEAAFSGTYSGKITYTGNPNGTATWGYGPQPINYTGMTRCAPGEFVGGSVAIKMERTAWWSVGLIFMDENFQTLSGTWYYRTKSQHPGGGQWAVSVAEFFAAPAGTAWVAAVPRISINSSWDVRDNIAPTGEVVYCDMHRIWTSPYNVQGAPTDYVSPRKVTIDVKANRVNLVNNPSITSGLKGWGTSGYGTMPFPGSHDNVVGRLKPGSYRFATPDDVSSYGVSASFGAGLLTATGASNIGGFGYKASTVYTASVYVRLGPNCPSARLSLGYPIIDGVLTTEEAREHPELVDGEWVRLWATFMTGSGENGIVALTVLVDSAQAQATGVGALFWLDDALVEEGGTLRGYFDGSSTGADYLWAGEANYSSSHYYRGFRSSAYRLNDIAKSALPHGTQVELRYARPPM